MTDDLATVSRSEQEGVIVATVSGEIDASNATEVGRELSDISNRVRGLVVDLGAVGHIDSTGIALLYELHLRLTRRGQGLAVVAPGGSAAHRVLGLTAFDTRAPVVAGVEEAVAAAASSESGYPSAPERGT